MLQVYLVQVLQAPLVWRSWISHCVSCLLWTRQEVHEPLELSNMPEEGLPDTCFLALHFVQRDEIALR